MLLIRLAIIVLSGLGFLGVGGISLSHWTGEAGCPMLGPIPACYVIFVGYGLILLSTFVRSNISVPMFFIGWLPVMVLAFIGVIGDITSTVTCPMSEIGIPKCYFSAALSLLIGLLYWRFYKAQGQN